MSATRKTQFLMTRRGALCGCAAFLATTRAAPAFDWDYKDVQFDLTEEAILGTKDDFLTWRERPLRYIRDKFEVAVPADPLLVHVGSAEDRGGYSLTPVELTFPDLEKDGGDLHYVVAIAKPTVTNGLPTIIAINGHGEVGGEGHGQMPEKLFQQGSHGDALARRGFTIAAFPNTIHAPLAHLYAGTDYSIIWARLADKALTAIRSELPADRPFIVVGNAAGGLTGLVLTIARGDIEALTTNGSFFSLEHTRREYRIYTHPFCHDFRAFFSYSAVYALIAPKPLLIQEGRSDALWLQGGPAPSSSWFSGMKRGAISDETVGAFLELQQVWSKFGAQAELDNHPNGHEDVDASAVEAFIGRVVKGAR